MFGGDHIENHWVLGEPVQNLMFGGKHIENYWVFGEPEKTECLMMIMLKTTRLFVSPFKTIL